jgi:DNA-directed RNA polymerase specialized sigma24 family protein
MVDGLFRRKLQRQSDERIASLIAGGSNTAVEALDARYHAALASYCARVLGARSADAASRQTLARACRALREGIQPLRLRPWLFAIAVEVCRDGLRDDADRSGASGIAAGS